MRIFKVLLLATALITMPMMASAANVNTISARQVQQALAEEGFRTSIDGIWGPQSVRALRSFQQANDLPVTGRLDYATFNELNLKGSAKASGREASSSYCCAADRADVQNISPAAGDAQAMDRGYYTTTTRTNFPLTAPELSVREIQALQQSLRDMGFLKGNVTGIWSIETAAALGSFQDSKGMRMTGILDDETRTRMGLRLPDMIQID